MESETLPSPPPVFVLSAARSGSTLLRLTLGKVPGIVSLPESFFWVFREQHGAQDLSRPDERAAVADAWTRFHRIAKWPVDREALRVELAEGATSWPRLLELTVRRYLQDTGVAARPDLVWIEKSPPHVFRRAAIEQDFPDARFIELVRDPRDVVASLKTCPWASSNVYTSARVWRSAAATLVEQPNTIRVHYEALVSDPAGELQRICTFLGRAFDPACLEAPTSDAVEERNLRSEASLRPISKSYIHSWERRLSAPDRELAIVQHVCGDAMRRLGYEPAAAQYDLAFRARLTLGWLGLVTTKLLG